MASNFFSKVSVKVFKRVEQERQEDWLLVQAAQKNSDEYRKLYDKYKDNLFRYVMYHVGHDKGVASDLVQDVFFKAFSHLKDFKEANASYLTYLRRIAHNQIVNFYRKKKTLGLDDVADSDLAETGSRIEMLVRDIGWYGLKELSQTEREIFVMRYEEGMRVHEIAVLLQKSDNAVKLHLSRARRKLRRRLKD
jgi:RNA polymerase sigma-70 factor (ECF subfamily)